jgi:hypothetical protein
VRGDHPHGNDGGGRPHRGTIGKIRQRKPAATFRLVSILDASSLRAMLLLAVTALEKLHAVPIKFWINLGMAVLILAAAIIIIRKAAQMNKILLSVIIFVVITCVGFNWIYSRNEPAFLTPLVEKIAPFLPTAGSYTAKQQKAPKP